MSRSSLAILEVDNLTPALVAADRCAKMAGVEIIGIESADGPPQCIKLQGSAEAVRLAAEHGLATVHRMGGQGRYVVMPAPTDDTLQLAGQPPAFIPLLAIYDARVKKEPSMVDRNQGAQQALGLLETQGLAAALHATDEMLKAASVSLVGKEKIGAAYVTIMVRGDVASVEAAIAAGRSTVERLGGTLILADVIPRPHPELVSLLPG
jgi:ethanolamine utilization protein EutM